MNKEEKDRLLADLARTKARICRWKYGLVFFPLLYAGLAVLFAFFYHRTGRTEDLVMTIVLVVVIAASIHGYRQRLAQLSREERSLKEKLDETK